MGFQIGFKFIKRLAIAYVDWQVVPKARADSTEVSLIDER